MGKPLISDAQMLAIYRVMQRLEATRPSPAAATASWPAAMLAATLLQLEPGDFLVTESVVPAAEEVLSLAREHSFSPGHLPFRIASTDRNGVAALATGYALAQRRYSYPCDSAPVTLALLRAGAPVQEAMSIAGEHLLPLLLVVREEPNQPRQPLASVENVEVIQVDAEDAVAVCRVVQESMVRARNRWGSVVLRAVTLPGTTGALSAFEAHLRRRGLLQ